MRFSIDEIGAVTRRLLEAAGLSAADSIAASDIFARASLRNVGHHDIYFLPQRLEWLTEKGVNPTPSFKRETSSGAAETWDGDKGLGELCCRHVTVRAMALAKSHGIGYAAVRNSNHFLAASPYCEIGAENGFMIMVFSNTDPCMSFPGGDKNVIGNNPLGFGIPRRGDRNLMLDVCMAYSSLGNLKAHVKRGEKIPLHWAKDSGGGWTDDPDAALNGGSIQPIARHKGFGLSLMTEALTGILAGGATGNKVAKGGGINTHNQAVIAFDLQAFGGTDTVMDRVEDLASRLKAEDPRIRLPGERSAEEERIHRARGLDLDDALVNSLRAWSEKFGIAPLPGQ